MGEASEILIRIAEAADAEAVAEVYLASRKRFLSYAPLIHTDEQVRRWVRDELISTGGVYVAVAGSEILGMMALSQDGNFSWIDQLYLRPDWVGQGIGALLLERAKVVLAPPVRLYCFQQNLKVRGFYERHGFNAVTFGDGRGNEERCPDVLYEWAVKS